MKAKLKRPITTCRLKVIRSDGSSVIYYSQERIPFWRLARRIKAYRHLRFMKKEDR